MSGKYEIFDAAERVTKLLQQMALLGLGAYLAWHLVPIVPEWAKKLENSQITQLSVPGLDITLLASAQQQLVEAVRSETSQKSAQDEGLARDKKLIVEALENIRAASAQLPVATAPVAYVDDARKPAAGVRAVPEIEPFWVYLGVAKGNTITTNNFRLSKFPSAGDIIAANTEVFKRGSAPISKEGDGWFLGDAVGVVRSGQTVRVLSLKKIDSTQPGAFFVWAEVSAAGKG